MNTTHLFQQVFSQKPRAGIPTAAMKARHLTFCLGCLMLLCSVGCKKQSDRTAPLPVYTVQVEHPRWGEVAEYQEWLGALYGGSSAQIEPQVSGYVSQKLFGTGELVRKGQILYRIDPTRYEQTLARARQQQEQAQANYDEARQNAAYYRPLVAGGSISRQTYTDAVQREHAAAAALEAAKANTDLARTDVEYCTLHAPIDGITGFAQADVGSYVSPQGPPMVLINSVDPISIHFSITSQEWLNQGGSHGTLRPGAKLTLILPNGATFPAPATITGVDNMVNNTTGTLMLDAQAPNPDDLLRPGMFVRVRAQIVKPRKALLVPQQAVVSIQGKNMLLCVDAKERVTLIPVTTGLTQGNMVAVSGAVNERDLIITEGTQQGLMAASGRAKVSFTSP